ncbi:MAG: 1,4-dihydroxy-2-naphthoate polyprenyltransferase [Thermodesulfobacteriota bacterium]
MTPPNTPVKTWIMALRPKTLPAGAAPVILGVALAYGSGIHVPTALCTLVCCLLLQAGANLANDYFDSRHGVDGDDRLGPIRVTQAGLVAPGKVRASFLFCFGLALLLGAGLALRGGAGIVAVGLAALCAAYLYTGGPRPLSYMGLGELLAFVFFGPVAVAGTFYLQTLSLSWRAVFAGAGPGFLAALLMSVNNLRDIASDMRTGKRTVAVLLGESRARLFSLALLGAACIVPAAYLCFYPGSPAVLLAPLSALLFFRDFLRVARGPLDARLNLSLAATGKYLFVYSVLFSAGVIL